MGNVTSRQSTVLWELMIKHTVRASDSLEIYVFFVIVGPVTLLHHGLTGQLVSTDWQEPNHCRDKAGLSNKHGDDQVNVSSPDKVNERMTEWLDNEGRHVQEPSEWAELWAVKGVMCRSPLSEPSCRQMLTNDQIFGIWSFYWMIQWLTDWLID